MTDYKILIAQAAALHEHTVRHRRHLHAHPELSFGEHETARYIAAALDTLGIPHVPIAGTGVLARIEGRGDLRRAVVLRADTDALPIGEQTGLAYGSQNAGVMHACGHDMHAAALLGALALLNSRRDEIEGTVLGLFQPGEECCPGGASLVLAEHPFDAFDIRAFVGQHVDPDLAVGTFGLRAGVYTASSDELHITVRGVGGHAAMPSRLRDPVVAAAQIVTALQQVVSRNADGNIPTVLSIGRLIADGATNIIPDEVTMQGTLRTFDADWRAGAKERIRAIASGVASAYGTEAIVTIRDGYPSVVNDPVLTRRTADILGALAGTDRVLALDRRMTAEDFGYYTAHYPSVFYRLGVGRPGEEPQRLHTPGFAPDERALDHGAAALAALALSL
ncbi:MAG: amidohydrolase [Rikenellaceae bacterium]|nr:amidohydrolase [Rikenellaceae bacterium]